MTKCFLHEFYLFYKISNVLNYLLLVTCFLWKDKTCFTFPLINFNYFVKFRDYNVISSSIHFDLKYYSMSSGIKFPNRNKAIIHYIMVGERINLDPCVEFSRFRYLCHNQDLNNMRMLLLTHFILFADKENRNY